MCPMIICVAVATLGIDAGWQRMPDGGMEYIIQLGPQDLEAMRRGEPLGSDIPPAAGDVRSYRVIFGTGPLKKEPPPAGKIPLKPSASETKASIKSPPASPSMPSPLSPDPVAKKMTDAMLLPPPSPMASHTETMLQPSSSGEKPKLGQPAIFEEPKGRSDPSTNAPNRTAPGEHSDRPWMPLTVTLLGLFASLGANVFLGWVAWGFRQRYAECTTQRSISLPT